MESKKTVKLIMVTEENNNKFYNMVDLGDGTWEAEWGRVELTSSKKVYPMSQWDKKYREKTKKGYKDVTELHVVEEVDNSKVVDIKDNAVKSVIEQLQAYANNTVKQNYSISKEAVTQKMVDEAQAIVDDLANDAKLQVATADQMNKKLIELYQVIPRYMKHVQHHLFPTEVAIDWTKVQKKIKDEQDTLDTMAGQVALIAKQRETAKDDEKAEVNLLDQMGLVMEVAGGDEFQEIKKMMKDRGQSLKRAYKVANVKTEKIFQKDTKSAKNKQTELFFHGSRNQNWFNILQTGLMIRPSGAIHTGSMFGDGIYGANKAQKAIGYSSLRGSYWTSGSDNKGFIGLFAFRVGNQKHIKHHDSSCYSLNKKKLMDDGYDSVYAHGGADLRNDEFIVYDAAQVTVKYLLELE